MRPTNVSLEQRQHMAEMYAEGKSIREIAIEMGYTPPCVTYQLRCAGVELRASGKPAERFLTEEEFAKVIDWFRQGASRQNIAGRLKMSRTTLYNVLGRYVVDHISDFIPKTGDNAPNSEIEHPEHYTYGGRECIENMLTLFGRWAVIAYCKCAHYKYLYRKGHKGTEKDAERDQQKADWYARKAEELSNEDARN